MCIISLALRVTLVKRIEYTYQVYPKGKCVPRYGVFLLVLTSPCTFSALQESSPDCFYTAMGQTCADMQQRIDSPANCSQKASEAATNELGFGRGAQGVSTGYQRATGAYSLVHEYYTSEIAGLVGQLYEKDLHLFNYPMLL